MRYVAGDDFFAMVYAGGASAYFEVSLPSVTDEAWRLAVKAAFQEKLHVIDPTNKRRDWNWPEGSFPHEPAAMPQFLIDECLVPLKHELRDHRPVQLSGTTDLYCDTDKGRVCYHAFQLINPETSLVYQLNAFCDSDPGCLTTELRLIMAYVTALDGPEPTGGPEPTKEYTG